MKKTSGKLNHVRTKSNDSDDEFTKTSATQIENSKGEIGPLVIVDPVNGVPDRYLSSKTSNKNENPSSDITPGVGAFIPLDDFGRKARENQSVTSASGGTSISSGSISYNKAVKFSTQLRQVDITEEQKNRVLEYMARNEEDSMSDDEKKVFLVKYLSKLEMTV